VTTEFESHLGVSCVRCGEPIPQIGQRETNLPYVFTARCKLCEFESVYVIGGLQRFDEQRRRRTTRPR
jgi:hypothetical protein